MKTFRLKSVDHQHVPKFISIVAMMIGCCDLFRGFMHTFLLKYSALNIAGFDLNTSQAYDLLRLLGIFGTSNLVTGVMLILMACKARQLALIMLGIIPLAYTIGILNIRLQAVGIHSSEALWHGLPFIMIYLVICIVTFVFGISITWKRARSHGTG